MAQYSEYQLETFYDTYKNSSEGNKAFVHTRLLENVDAGNFDLDSAVKEISYFFRNNMNDAGLADSLDTWYADIPVSKNTGLNISQGPAVVLPTDPSEPDPSLTSNETPTYTTYTNGGVSYQSTSQIIKITAPRNGLGFYDSGEKNEDGQPIYLPEEKYFKMPWERGTVIPLGNQTENNKYHYFRLDKNYSANLRRKSGISDKYIGYGWHNPEMLGFTASGVDHEWTLMSESGYDPQYKTSFFNRGGRGAGDPYHGIMNQTLVSPKWFLWGGVGSGFFSPGIMPKVYAFAKTAPYQALNFAAVQWSPYLTEDYFHEPIEGLNYGNPGNKYNAKSFLGFINPNEDEGNFGLLPIGLAVNGDKSAQQLWNTGDMIYAQMHKEPDDDGNYNWSYFVPISKHETDQYIVDIASDDPLLMPPANPMLYTLEKHVKSVSVEQALSKNKDYHSGQSGTWTGGLVKHNYEAGTIYSDFTWGGKYGYYGGDVNSLQNFHFVAGQYGHSMDDLYHLYSKRTVLKPPGARRKTTDNGFPSDSNWGYYDFPVEILHNIVEEMNLQLKGNLSDGKFEADNKDINRWITYAQGYDDIEGVGKQLKSVDNPIRNIIINHFHTSHIADGTPIKFADAVAQSYSQFLNGVYRGWWEVNDFKAWSEGNIDGSLSSSLQFKPESAVGGMRTRLIPHIDKINNEFHNFLWGFESYTNFRIKKHPSENPQYNYGEGFHFSGQKVIDGEVMAPEIDVYGDLAPLRINEYHSKTSNTDGWVVISPNDVWDAGLMDIKSISRMTFNGATTIFDVPPGKREEYFNEIVKKMNLDVGSQEIKNVENMYMYAMHWMDEKDKAYNEMIHVFGDGMDKLNDITSGIQNAEIKSITVKPPYAVIARHKATQKHGHDYEMDKSHGNPSYTVHIEHDGKDYSYSSVDLRGKNYFWSFNGRSAKDWYYEQQEWAFEHSPDYARLRGVKKGKNYERDKKNYIDNQWKNTDNKIWASEKYYNELRKKNPKLFKDMDW